MINRIKDDFTQPLSIKEILDELKISKDDDYRVLSISKDEDLELHLKRQPNLMLARRLGHGKYRY